jgi:hypothetical protein
MHVRGCGPALGSAAAGVKNWDMKRAEPDLVERFGLVVCGIGVI